MNIVEAFPFREALRRSAWSTYAFWVRSWTRPAALIGVLTAVGVAVDDSIWSSLLTAAVVYVAVLPVLTLVGAVMWSRRRSGRRLWVADEAGVTAGLEVQEAEGQPVRVSGLFAVPQGRGHADRLTKELLAWADREGKTLALRVVGGRLRQRYEAAGFRPDPYQRGIARHLLPRLLRAPGARGALTAPDLSPRYRSEPDDQP